MASETTPKQYIINRQGERVGVILDIEEYRQMLEAIEELDAIRAYDEAKSSNEEVIPFEQAIREIESAGE